MPGGCLGVKFFTSRTVQFRERSHQATSSFRRDSPGDRSQEGPRYRAGCRKLKMGIRALEKLAILQKYRGLFQVTPSACSRHQCQNLLKDIRCCGHLWKQEAPAYAAPPVQPTRPPLRRRCCPPAATVGRARCVHAGLGRPSSPTHSASLRNPEGACLRRTGCIDLLECGPRPCWITTANSI